MFSRKCAKTAHILETKRNIFLVNFRYLNDGEYGNVFNLYAW